jgi:hypothetical protein
MQRDVPDAALTIIGNTDAVGTDAYNDDLSERRAIHVMRLLTEDGLDPLQMTTVAIGDRQPVAPNDTPEGRAKNRRVEFLISASVQANLAAVQYQKVDPAFLGKSDNRISTATVVPTTVTVLQSHATQYSRFRSDLLRSLQNHPEVVLFKNERGNAVPITVNDYQVLAFNVSDDYLLSSNIKA